LPAKEGTDQDNLFTRIGVRPLINGRGTFTIISGSRSLPQVKQAMFEASNYFVQLDEMMDGIGAQLGKLTGAEWGIATTGCDAAAEEPISPNIHIAAGATLVGYSGGKCLRGPQSSGMMIGQKDLCKAAYYQASPHHCYGRAFKCSKEEAMGLLAAVQQWYKRDHAAEQREWRSWLND